ncbi:MAG: hypothetical protein FOGNACKC_05437 [Anaerolineae bacterium]|nr:hypothetical protein [Anaerolineae bacterium]
MKKTKWWLRIVGGFYLLLTLLNLYALFFSDLQIFRDTLPFPADAFAVRAFADAWMVFIFELGVLGAMMLYASREPAQSKILVLTVVMAEVFRGVVADAVWIGRGYSPASYIPFIIVHLIIIATGILFVRQEFSNS